MFKHHPVNKASLQLCAGQKWHRNLLSHAQTRLQWQQNSFIPSSFCAFFFFIYFFYLISALQERSHSWMFKQQWNKDRVGREGKNDLCVQWGCKHRPPCLLRRGVWRSVGVEHKLRSSRGEEMKLLDRCRGQIAGRQIRAEICTGTTNRQLAGNITGWQTSCEERVARR